jgi:putative tryptophan/tyrosine transport system substrate-binding protein
MRRRDFITFLGGIVSWPISAIADQSRVAKIGILVAGTPDPQPFWTIFQQTMRDRGYIEGQNIRFEYRSAEGDTNRLGELAAELVQLNVDIIVAWQTPAVTAAKQATSNIPIVMAGSGDPVGTGLVASLARPGGNVTGVASMIAELAGKSVELIRELIPSATKVAALCNGLDPFYQSFLHQIELGGRTTGIAIKPMMLVPMVSSMAHSGP